MKDIASHVGVTPETIRSWIKTKEFPAQKVGHQWRFKYSAVDAWTEGRCSETDCEKPDNQSEHFEPTLTTATVWKPFMASLAIQLTLFLPTLPITSACS